jgi:hypothetical protein
MCYNKSFILIIEKYAIWCRRKFLRLYLHFKVVISRLLEKEILILDYANKVKVLLPVVQAIEFCAIVGRNLSKSRYWSFFGDILIKIFIHLSCVKFVTHRPFESSSIFWDKKARSCGYFYAGCKPINFNSYGFQIGYKKKEAKIFIEGRNLMNLDTVNFNKRFVNEAEFSSTFCKRILRNYNRFICHIHAIPGHAKNKRRYNEISDAHTKSQFRHPQGLFGNFGACYCYSVTPLLLIYLSIGTTIWVYGLLLLSICFCIYGAYKFADGLNIILKHKPSRRGLLFVGLGILAITLFIFSIHFLVVMIEN